MTRSPRDDARALRVLHVVTRAQRRGAEASAMDLSERLAALGQQTRVVALAPAEAGDPLPVEVLGPTPLSVRTLWRLRAHLRTADVAIAHGSRTLPAVGLAGRGLRRPAVYQNIGDPTYWAGSGARRLRVRVLLRGMSAVAALTDSIAKVLTARYGVPEERVSVVPNWRSGRDFRPPHPEERAAAREALDLGGDHFVVAMVGALSPEKGVDLAIEAAALVPNSTLVLAGDGPDREDLEAQAGRLAPGRVRFLGSLPDVRPVLHAADAFLLTSRSEGVPGVLIEAGLCGLPAVCTDVGFVTDVVVPGMTGWVTEPCPDAIASALAEARAEGDGRGRAAREHCVERFDSDRVAGQWLSVLRSVVD